MNENWLHVRWKTGYECWIENSEEKLVFWAGDSTRARACNRLLQRLWRTKGKFIRNETMRSVNKKKKMDKWYWIRERKEIDRVPLFCHWILLNKKIVMLVPHFKCVLLNFSFFENYCILDYKKIGGLQYSKAYNNNLFNQRRSNTIVLDFLEWNK